MEQELIAELEAIDSQAFAMALSVFKNPELRSELAEKASLLSHRLNFIFEELKRKDLKAYLERSEIISEATLDLNFVEMDIDAVSLRLGTVIETEKLKQKRVKIEYEIVYPLPEDGRNISRTLKSDLVQFQTGMDLKKIADFYRQAFTKMGLVEYTLLTQMTKEYVGLMFVDIPREKAVTVQAIDLGYSSDQDLRHVSLRSEEFKVRNK